MESKSYIATPPGATIKEQLAYRGMTQKEFANRMGMSEKHISRLINGDVHLTPDTAERLELVLGVPASFWNRLEAIYQEKMAKVRRERESAEEEELAKQYPYNELSKLGVVPKTSKANEKAVYLCKYFEVSSLKLVQNHDLMPIACRKLSDTRKSIFAMLALAQYAKIKARDIETKPFNGEKLHRKIKEIRKLTLAEDTGFSEKLTDILSECGVALVFLPQIQGSFLHGVSFVSKNDKVVIGITMRGKDADRFWFSLFHEIAHILLGHIYQQEGVSDKDELDADKLASSYLIPDEKLRAFYAQANYSIQSISSFAQALGIGRGILIGRLQHDKKIPYSQFNAYKIKYQEVA